MEITQQNLNNVFYYQDGRIFYNKKVGKMLPGNEAGALSPQGYVHIGIFGKKLRRHQIVFMMFNGFIPKEIDHIDGNKSNDCIENLRECSHADNMKNKKLNKRNVTGYRGVSIGSNGGKYCAYISIEAKRIYLGSFNSAYEASVAYEAAAKVLYGKYNRLQFVQ